MARDKILPVDYNNALWPRDVDGQIIKADSFVVCKTRGNAFGFGLVHRVGIKEVETYGGNIQHLPFVSLFIAHKRYGRGTYLIKDRLQGGLLFYHMFIIDSSVVPKEAKELLIEEQFKYREKHRE